MADILNTITNALGVGTKNTEQVIQGNFQPIVQSQTFNSFLFIMKIVVWFGAVVVFGMIIHHYFFRYNKRVMIKKLKGTSIIDIYFDRGRIMKDLRGKDKLNLLKTRKSCPVPSYDYTNKMGKSDFYELYLDEYGNLSPINETIFIKQVKEQRVIEGSKSVDFHILSSWRLEEMKLAEEKFKKKSLIEKYLPEFLVFIAMVCAVGIIWITMKSVTSSGMANAQAMQQLAQAIASLK